ncbi:MAG TPA: DHHA1 domain-containing protein [Candidatus Kapabacteria bacterium]|jgi:oligoribonuclease NrnB/cAMP/cGMP phosphodiesterase (DHH superfamily)|nr:DHHA1 domain-containing protein [Candidatus Kapabacteria bacterium]
MSVLCFYHSPCNDGAGSAIALEHRLRRAGIVAHDHDLRLCPLNYTTEWDQPLPPGYLENEIAPDRPVDTIYMVDITFSKVKFEQIVEHLKRLDRLAVECPRMICIDHHRSALDREAELREFCDETYIKMGSGLSGATLVWHYFNEILGEDLPVPTLLQYIADQDIWEWKLECSREINAALNVFEGHAEQIREELERSMADEAEWRRLRLTEGHAIVEMVDSQVNKTAWQAIDIPAGRVTLRVLNSASFSSELGNHLSNESDLAPNVIALIYSIQRDWDVRVSLRSISGGAVNAREFAERFGGGGHDNAAGCRFASFEEFRAAIDEVARTGL